MNVGQLRGVLPRGWGNAPPKGAIHIGMAFYPHIFDVITLFGWRCQTFHSKMSSYNNKVYIIKIIVSALDIFKWHMEAEVERLVLIIV